MTVKIEEKKIGGKTYLMVLCPRCDVWIDSSKFNESSTPMHPDCDKYTATRASRERATARVCGIMNKMFR